MKLKHWFIETFLASFAQAALREENRELREELDLPVRVGRILDAAPETEFHEFLILYYAAEMTGPQPVLKEHADCRFVSPEELTGYEFSTADQVVAGKIARGEIRL